MSPILEDNLAAEILCSGHQHTIDSRSNSVLDWPAERSGSETAWGWRCNRATDGYYN